jgi:hypothetical protein
MERISGLRTAIGGLRHEIGETCEVLDENSSTCNERAAFLCQAPWSRLFVACPRHAAIAHEQWHAVVRMPKKDER